MSRYTYSENIFDALDYKLNSDPNFTIIGQGLWSPWYVGNTMKNLEKKYGKDRLIDTPVSEAATTGMALGLSIHGSKVLMLHPRMDFSLLSFDQIINQISNWELMFGGNSIPNITLRLIINRGGEQGAQHSQALHSILSHFPNLKVVTPYSADDAGILLLSAINYNGPVIYIDDRWLYDEQTKKIQNYSNSMIPNLKNINPKILERGNDITFVSFGYGSKIINELSKNLKKNNISSELIDLRIINPFKIKNISKSVSKTKKIVFVDIGYKYSSIGSTLISELNEILNFNFKSKVFGLYDTSAPTNKYLENFFYHDTQFIYKKVLKEFF